MEGSAGASALVPPPGQAGACRIRVCVRALTGRGARKPRESRIKRAQIFFFAVTFVNLDHHRLPPT